MQLISYGFDKNLKVGRQQRNTVHDIIIIIIIIIYFFKVG